MKKELVDFLRQIKIHPSLRSLGEIQTKSGIIEPILRYLGWECKTGRNACMTPSYEQEISANLERAVSNEKTS